MSEIIKSVLENDYRQKGFEIEISGFVDVYEDDYKKGEISNVNYWELKSKYFIIDDILKNKELIKKEVIDYINNELFNNIECSEYKALFSCCMDNRILWSQLCDEKNSEPTETQYQLWKDGKIKLYTQNFDISIKINNIEVSESDMVLIFE